MTTLTSAKKKGRDGEQAVADYLAANGFPLAERRRLEGVLDRGDLAGIYNTIVEVKACATADAQAWWREAEQERRNAVATYAAVWWRPPRRVDPARGVVIVNHAQLLLLRNGQGGPVLTVFPRAWKASELPAIADYADDHKTFDGDPFLTVFSAWWPITASRVLSDGYYVTTGAQWASCLRRIVGETDQRAKSTVC